LAVILRLRTAEPAIGGSALNLLTFKIRAADHPGCAFAELSRRQHGQVDQTPHSRLAHLEDHGSFFQCHLATFAPLAVAVWRDASMIAQYADP
jgi:hypothetical protein